MKTSLKKIVLSAIVSFGLVAGCAPVASINVSAMPDGIYRDSEGLFEIRGGRQYRLSGNATPTPTATATATATPAPGTHKSLDDAVTKAAVYDHYLGYGLSVTQAVRVTSTYYRVTFRNNAGEVKREDVTIEDGTIHYRNAVIITPVPTPTPTATATATSTPVPTVFTSFSNTYGSYKIAGSASNNMGYRSPITGIKSFNVVGDYVKVEIYTNVSVQSFAYGETSGRTLNPEGGSVYINLLKGSSTRVTLKSGDSIVADFDYTINN